MRLRKILYGLSALWGLLAFNLILPALSHAAENPEIITGLDAVETSTLASKIITIGTTIGGLAGAVAVVMLILTGFKLTTAANEQAKAEARSHFVQIITGLVVIGMAVVIVGFVANVIT